MERLEHDEDGCVSGYRGQVNKKIIRELLMTVDTLANRMKWLEQQDRIRHSQITELHTRNVDISEAIARIRQNYSSHVMVRTIFELQDD